MTAEALSALCVFVGAESESQAETPEQIQFCVSKMRPKYRMVEAWVRQAQLVPPLPEPERAAQAACHASPRPHLCECFSVPAAPRRRADSADRPSKTAEMWPSPRRGLRDRGDRSPPPST